MYIAYLLLWASLLVFTVTIRVTKLNTVLSKVDESNEILSLEIIYNQNIAALDLSNQTGIIKSSFTSFAGKPVYLSFEII